MTEQVVIEQDGNKGFKLYGSTREACDFVLGLDVGYVSHGVRHLSRDECTEELLSNIEQHFDLRVLL